MLNEELYTKIKKAMSEVSSSPWTWRYSQGEEPTDIPELLKLGIDTIPTTPRNIQLMANGKHRFWVELTDTKLPDVVFDFDFIVGAREWLPELVAEIDRLRGLLGKEAH